jgi:hypothetical protein
MGQPKPLVKRGRRHRRVLDLENKKKPPEEVEEVEKRGKMKNKTP